MRISDWSSDVCSSDLNGDHAADPDIIGAGGRQQPIAIGRQRVEELAVLPLAVKGREGASNIVLEREERKSVVSGKSVSVRVDIGGRRIIKIKNTEKHCTK